MRILAFGAHPDDIEFGCAPALLKEEAAGNAVALRVLSRGEAGTAGTPEGRERESRAAAAVLGAEIEFMDLGGDCRMEYTPGNALLLAAEIRKLQPAVVLAPRPEENQHPDHAVAGRLARDACRLARYGGLKPLLPLPPHRIGQLYFYDITKHGTRSPDIVIDIGGVMERWEAAMRCHASQVQTKGYVELQKAAARLLGLSVGVEYAAGLYGNEPVRVERLSDLGLSARNF